MVSAVINCAARVYEIINWQMRINSLPVFTGERCYTSTLR